MEVSRMYSKERLSRMMEENGLERELASILRKSVSLDIQKTLMLNELIDKKGFKLPKGERRSYNTGTERKQGGVGRPRTEGRIRTCKKVKKKELGERIKKQGDECLEVGKEIGQAQAKVENLRVINMRVKMDVVRRLGRKHKLSNVQRKTKAQIIEELKEKGVVKYNVGEFAS